MMLTSELLYKKLYGFEMIREPANPNRIDTPLQSIEDIQKFVDRCNGNKPAFMSIYSYEKPYKVTRSEDTGKRIDTEYSALTFDRIILDFDIQDEDRQFQEGFTSADIIEKGKEIIEKENATSPEDRHIKITDNNCKRKGMEYYNKHYFEKKDKEAINKLIKQNSGADKSDIAMKYHYDKYTSKEYLITPYKEAIKTAEYLRDMFGFTPLLFFSGGHGIHLHLLFNPIDIPNYEDVVSHFGLRLIDTLNLTTLDKSVIKGIHKHLIRIPLSRHQTTKLYVTPLDLKTSYMEMLDNATKPEINVDLVIDQDTALFEDFIKNLSDFLEKTATKPNERQAEYEYTLNGSLFDLQEPFSRIYKQGQRNYTAHPLIHFFKGAGIPKQDVEQFFDTLQVGTGLDSNVQTWIDTAYNRATPYQQNMGYFINTVKNFADSQEDADYIIKKFNEYFNQHDKVVTKNLKPFKIGVDARKYEVTATLVNNKYSEIRIKDLYDAKNFDFVFDISNNVSKFVSTDKDMTFKFKYNFNQGGYEIKSKTEFKTIRNNISDILNIKIADAFEYSLSNYLGSLYSEIEKHNIETETTANIDVDIDDEYIKELILAIMDDLDERSRTSVEQGCRTLSNLLTEYYGVILRKYIGTLYKIKGNGYEPTSHDDLIQELTKVFGKNFIHDTDLKKAIGYLSDRLEPVPDVVKFENTLFDMTTLEPIESDTPIFTVLNIPYSYNPNADSEMFKNFLDTTFEREDAEATAEAVKGIKQLCGYFFTSGNSLEILPIFTGLTGAGKTTFLNILTGIFGKDKISGISLQALENDIHASSGFIGRHLNIIRDSDVSMIKNNSILKTWTGNEAYPVNPKFKDLYDLPAEEVPKPILACNTMPVFKTYEDAIIRRFVIVEFRVSMTKKGTAIKDLDKLILADKQEVEWFIYESIQAYKEMLDNGETFVFKISDEATKELIEKHTHPLNHILQMLILKHDPEAYDTEKTNDLDDNFTPVFTDDLVDAIIHISEREGIDIPLNKHNKIDKRKLIEVIRDEFDLHDGEIVKHKETKQYTLLREYKPRQERFNGLNKKAYPNLIAKKEYIEILAELKKPKDNPGEDKQG